MTLRLYSGILSGVEGYTWSNTSVEEKVGLSAGGHIGGGGGAYRQRNTE